jgi:phosphoketolase
MVSKVMTAPLCGKAFRPPVAMDVTRRTNHGNIHVRANKEEVTITTPFDMTVLNDLDRIYLLMTPLIGCRKLTLQAPR